MVDFNGAIEYAEKLALSRLSDHQEVCCENARSWFLAMDQAFYSHNRALPSWIRKRHQWGPSRWPLYWCEAMEKEKLDCGALTALALEAFASRGRKALPCQLIRKYDRRTIEQWQEAWDQAGCSRAWAVGEYAYHEACGIVTDKHVEIWDPSGNIMVRPDSTIGYESTVALRLNGTASNSVIWVDMTIPLNKWIYVDDRISSIRCELPVWRS